MKTKPFGIFPVLVVVLSLIAIGAGPQNILGVTVQRPSGSGSGVQIVSVAPGSACQSVLPSGDIIAYLNPNGGLTGNRAQDLAYEVSNLTDFQSLVGKIRPGATATFLILSGTSAMSPPKKVSCRIPANAAVPASTPAGAPSPAVAPASGLNGQALLGITTKKPVGNSGGVAVASVAAGSPCQSVHVGDVISFLNPNGPLSGTPAADRPYQVRDQAQFASQASQIRPGATVSMKVLPATAFLSTGNIVTCNIPASGEAGGQSTYNAPAASAPAPAVSVYVTAVMTGAALLGVKVQSQGATSTGVKITAVAPGNPCQPALNVGDVIMYMNPNGGLSGIRFQDVPYEVRGPTEFLKLVSQIKPGSTATLKVFPAGGMFSAGPMGRTVTCSFPAAGAPGAQSAAYTEPATPVPQNILGIIVADDLTSSQKSSYVGGLRVKEVQPGSPCSGVLQAGNVITYLSPNGPVQMPPSVRANAGKHLQSLNDFDRLLAEVKPGATVGFLIYPGRSMFEMAFTRQCTIPAQAAPASQP